MSQPSFGELDGGDPYVILELSPCASDDDIRKARRRLLRRHHPDLPGGDLERTKMITAAADILLDRPRRVAYEHMVRERDGAVFTGSTGGAGRRLPSFQDQFEEARPDYMGWRPTGWRRQRGPDRSAGRRGGAWTDTGRRGESWAGTAGVRPTSGGAHRADHGAGRGPRKGQTPSGGFGSGVFGGKGAGVPRRRSRRLLDTGSAAGVELAGGRLAPVWAILKWCWLVVSGVLRGIRRVGGRGRATRVSGAVASVALLAIYTLWFLIH